MNFYFTQCLTIMVIFACLRFSLLARKHMFILHCFCLAHFAPFRPRIYAALAAIWVHFSVYHYWYILYTICGVHVIQRDCPKRVPQRHNVWIIIVVNVLVRLLLVLISYLAISFSRSRKLSICRLQFSSDFHMKRIKIKLKPKDM